MCTERQFWCVKPPWWTWSHRTTKGHVNTNLCTRQRREMTRSSDCCHLRWENRSANSPVRRETGLKMPCCPAINLLRVQITQSYPNRLRFWTLPCPESPCHSVCSNKDGGWRSVPHTLCRLFQTCRRTGVCCLLKSTFTQASHDRGFKT